MGCLAKILNQGAVRYNLCIESRPEGSIDRGILNYISSLKDDFAIFLDDIIESEAHVIMLHEIGYLSRRN